MKVAVDLRARMLQEQHSMRLMNAYIAYAVSIGCTVGEGAFSDSIEANAEQGVLLVAKWNELTEAYNGAN